MRLVKIVLLFCVIYAAASLSGNFLIDFTPLSWFAIGLLATFVFSLIGGITLGTACSRSSAVESSSALPYWVLGLGLILVVVTSGTMWFALLDQYGSFSAIWANSWNIRVSTIGQDTALVPSYISYLNHLVYALFALSLACFKHSRKIVFLAMSAVLFGVIVASDLTQFGRIGILFAIFCIAGYFLVYQKKILTIRNALFAGGLLVLLMLPRMIRGSFDNFRATVDHFSVFYRFDVPGILNIFVSVYFYYFVAPYALSEFLFQNSLADLSWGARTFTPFYNFLAKFTGQGRISLIDNMEKIPFDYNIFTIVRDLFGDFGIAGVLLLPFLWGILFGWVFKQTGIVADAIKIFFFAWLFYTPIFNVFSFGSFFIALCFLFILYFVTRLIPTRNSAISP